MFTEQAPNKRLKLPGGDRSKGSGAFVPCRARTVVPHGCVMTFKVAWLAEEGTGPHLVHCS
jgi:hypothetical protein